MKIGSLFSGAGGLDLAALELFPDAQMAWHCEVDQAASKVLRYHWPAVPNLGDITKVDWYTVEPVNALTGGFPCQDVSVAGHRAGIADGNRSGLWSYMCTAIDVLRPQYVLIENVRGLLNAPAIRNLEPGADALGDDGPKSVHRALGAVLGSLADIGFDADWTMLRASDVGACHHRARIFILAYPADAESHRPQGLDDITGRASACDGRVGHAFGSAGRASVSDADIARPQGGEQSAEALKSGASANSGRVVAFLPTPDTGVSPNGHGRRGGQPGNGRQSGMRPDSFAGWGEYGPAIRRQEALSRPAPSPTEPNSLGRPRLSAAFAEWMMWWPRQWVTDPGIGLGRTDQLRNIGNGVCPPQAVAAGRHLLRVSAVYE